MASFHKQLVLNQWCLSFFIGRNLQELKYRLGEDKHEGINEDGQTNFFHELTQNLFEIDLINEQKLRLYDLNIVQHWTAITERRNKHEGVILNMKYFQYLSLLFTEIYLDWHFNRPQELLKGLNEHLKNYNNSAEADNRFQLFQADELNKIAFWNATGSGKTLLLHVNIHQYLHYFQKGQDIFPDKIILLTPNEGLSRQHLDELNLSSFSFSRMFNKNRSGVFKGTIEIIDINKLGDEMGEKTVAVEAFEGKNLVLVDEGHRGTGTSAGAWMRRREVLTRGGFAFEYSATFGQAVAKGFTVKKAEHEIAKKKSRLLFGTTNINNLDISQRNQLALSLEDKRNARTLATREIYAKNILFDYSYKYFYEDGYGKESLILNLKDEDYIQDDISSKYFTACLLSFYQQQYLWSNNQQKLTEFNIEKPLWVFVGNTVSGEDSDILNVMKFFADFLNEDTIAKRWIKQLLLNEAMLLDDKGRNIFDNKFNPIMHLKVEDVYMDILKKLFNAETKQRLKVVNLKSCKGELSLRVGKYEPFGLINIGDDASLFKEVESDKNIEFFDSEADDFGGSVFKTLNNVDSKVHVLIGSRKFTEGWSSWRVSTMGLLNMGKAEGSQIIQLFGRGVRLKGKDYSLKRSTPSERPKGLHLERLETLNIFGVNAGYMSTFKEYLKEEGITPSDEILELNFETKFNLPRRNLKTLALKDGYKDNQIKGFKRSHYPWLYEVPEEFLGKIKLPHTILDLYPRLESLATKDETIYSLADLDIKQQGKIDPKVMSFFDFDFIYLAIQEFKLKRTWSNLRLDINKLRNFCLENNDWYTLYIPKNELFIQNISDIKKQENILIYLLKDYTDRFYKSMKSAYEGQFYTSIELKSDNDALLKIVQFEIEDTDEGNLYKARLEQLQKLITSGDIGQASSWNASNMVAICFDKHLYYPLFSIEGDVPLKMRPILFDAQSEVQFIHDLENFYASDKGRMLIGDRSLYLLRNADNKNKGLGFALAGNFYPDFLLWLVDDKKETQWLSFIDPKGIRNMDLSSPKFGLYKEVKLIQDKINDPKLIINAFILSVTKFKDLLNFNSSQEDLEKRNILFMAEESEKYLSKMFSAMN